MLATKKPSSSESPEEILTAFNALLTEGRTDGVVALFKKVVARNSELEQELALMLLRKRKSEKVSAAQLQFFFDQVRRGEATLPPNLVDENGALNDAIADDVEKAAANAKTKTPPPAPKPRIKRPIPRDIRRVDNPIPVPPDQRACPSCGEERSCFGHDTTEVIELIPAQIIVRRDMREKLTCDSCDGELVRAPVGEKIVSGGKLGIVLVSQIIADKYDDGLPLHRQQNRLRRLGIELPVSTLADQIAWAAELLTPLWHLLFAETITSTVMHLDGTGLPVLDRKLSGKTRYGSLWGYVGVSGDEVTCVYVFNSTGKKNGQRPNELGPEDVLAQRSGFTVADAATVFDRSFLRDDLIECGCNMHARRYFVKALDSGDPRAALPIRAFRKLYELERTIREREPRLSPDEILAERIKTIQPMWIQLVSWCLAWLPEVPPASRLGKALRYFNNHSEALGRFLEDGNVPLDNGIVERLHVRAAIARKNFLFTGSDDGGDRAAIMLTILANCRILGINPVEYLTDVLPQLTGTIRVSELSELLPRAWRDRRLARQSEAA